MAALAALLMLTAVAATPPDSATVADVRCAVVSVAITGHPDFAAVGAVSSLYWFGRLHHLIDAKALEDAMVAQALVMTPTDVKLEAARCGKEMEAEGERLRRLGEAIERRLARTQTH